MNINTKAVFFAVAAMALSSSALASVDVYVGYADGIRGGGFFPNPWDGDAGVSFFGGSGSGQYDAGAIMFVNSGATTVTLDPGVLVDNFNGGGTSFQLWDSFIGSGFAIAPGDKVILTQTSDYDFDTSDFSPFGSPNPTYKPIVHFSIDGTMMSDQDTGQVLNTNGFDLASTGSNESFRWRLIGGNGTPGAPAPGAAIVMLMGLVAKRRRKA